DLKSPNLLLFRHNGRDVVKICDFGLSKFREAATASNSGGIKGTPAWMPPEAFGKDKVTKKKLRPTKAFDVYSFGMVIFEFLARVVPWKGKDIYDIIEQLKDEPDERPAIPAGVEVDDGLVELMVRCWATDPNARPNF
ncbi:unnamed protein product, partial [Phaeothamnion confervicola]